MRLFEHLDFRDAILATKEHLNQQALTEQLIEKDYYVSEALRIVAIHYPTQIIFKGGTSLSKGWGLIERFSEDIDLFLNKGAFQPSLSRKGVDLELKKLEESVAKHPGLTLLQNKSQYKRSMSRNSYFSYNQIFPGLNTIKNEIFLEAGIRSGDYPIKTVEIISYIGRFLKDTEQSLDTDDESPFLMQLLDFTRTFVEKLFTIHSKIIKYHNEKIPIGSQARHYYDLFCLAKHPDVQTLLHNTMEYQNIKQDCAQKSREFFNSKDEDFPKDMIFSNSEALFPTGKLRQMIRLEYQQQCQSLCYGKFPT